MSEKRKVLIIPKNIVSNKRILGFRLRNIIEGIVLFVFTALIISLIPFVPRIKIIFTVVVGFTVFLLSCLGIKDKSPSELIIDTIKYISSPKSWSLRSINYGTEVKSNTSLNTNITTEQSIADKVIYYAKSLYAQYKETGEIPFIRK
jgi:hypothetical protein